MSVPSRPSSWSTTFGQCLTVYHLLPFSLRVSFAWEDREPSPQDSERLVRGPPDRPLLKSFSWPRDSVPYGLSRTSSGARVPIFGPSTRRRPHSSTRISKPGFTIPSRSEVAAHVAGERHLACRRFLRRPDGLHRATSGTGPSPLAGVARRGRSRVHHGQPLTADFRLHSELWGSPRRRMGRIVGRVRRATFGTT